MPLNTLIIIFEIVDNTLNLDILNINKVIPIKVPNKIEVNEIIKICKRYSITWITMKADIYNDDILAKLKQNGIQSCIFSVDTLTEAQHAIISGVDLVSTHYLSVNLLESLG